MCRSRPAKMQKKVVWYMVYRVRYLGNDMIPEAAKDAWGHELFDSKPVTQEGWPFFPQFVLASHDLSKSYQDRIIPAAKKPIEEREMRGQELLNTVEISRQPIPLSTADNPQEVWGLVTWEDIDPRLTYFSVYVKGLTNAYKPVDLPDGFKPGDPPGPAAISWPKRCNSTSGDRAIRSTSRRTRSATACPYDPDAERQSEDSERVWPQGTG